MTKHSTPKAPPPEKSYTVQEAMAECAKQIKAGNAKPPTTPSAPKK